MDALRQGGKLNSGSAWSQAVDKQGLYYWSTDGVGLMVEREMPREGVKDDSGFALPRVAQRRVPPAPARPRVSDRRAVPGHVHENQ
mgnify:CR=1 FL=1